jgi:hypothetical protein
MVKFNRPEWKELKQEIFKLRKEIETIKKENGEKNGKLATKKQKVQTVFLLENKPQTVNSLYFHITGERSGILWHMSRFRVSKSTVRRALDELVTGGQATCKFKFGHCFDSAIYEVKITG